MRANLDDNISLLGRTPAALRVLLQDLPDVWIKNDEGPGTWNPYDIVGHLLYAEHEVWIPRARMIRDAGTKKAFTAFDREGHRKEYEGASLDDLLNRFADARAASLEELQSWNLTAQELAVRGLHPALGEVMLSELLSAWTVHDLTHIHQMARVMAHQYREAVGPWGRYLGVLHCNGHGA
jgi:hypothetical protein